MGTKSTSGAQMARVKTHYKGLVVTGNEEGAEIYNATVSIWLTDVNGKLVGPIEFEPLDTGVFKRGNKDVLNITGKEDLGEIYSLAVRQEGQVRNQFAHPNQWMLDRIELCKVDLATGKETGEKQIFPFGKWLTTNRVYDCGSEKATRVDYGVKITTSDIIFAGTEDNIFIDIIGIKGCTHRQPLDGEYL